MCQIFEFFQPFLTIWESFLSNLVSSKKTHLNSESFTTLSHHFTLHFLRFSLSDDTVPPALWPFWCILVDFGWMRRRVQPALATSHSDCSSGLVCRAKFGELSATASNLHPRSKWTNRRCQTGKCSDGKGRGWICTSAAYSGNPQ